MDPPAADPTYFSKRLDPTLLGTVFGAISALGYTAANICLRQVAETCDPAWVSCVKAVPTAVVAWLLIARRVSRGQPALPKGRLLGVLVLTALAMQLGGNVSFQWSLGMLGLALTVPLLFGSLILGGALGGRIWLGEGISPRTALAMLTLIIAVAVLAFAADRDSSSLARLTTSDSAALVLVLALAAACFSGVCYAACNVVVRRVAGHLLPLSGTLMVMSTTGVVSLGLLSFWQIGPSGMWSTTAGQWLTMLLAGIFNAAAFFALGQALQVIPVTRTNLINASQVAMSALAGVVLFSERLTLPMLCGLLLTVFGLLMIQRRE